MLRPCVPSERLRDLAQTFSVVSKGHNSLNTWGDGERGCLMICKYMVAPMVACRVSLRRFAWEVMLYAGRCRHCSIAMGWPASPSVTVLYVVTMMLKAVSGLRRHVLHYLCRGQMAAAAFGGRVVLSSLLAVFVRLCLPGPQHRLYRCQTNAGGRMATCRDYCSR
jgi:hypothetical protein